MPWQLIITRPAERDIAGLHERNRTAVIGELDCLGENPSRVNLKKLAGRDNEWRMRVGRWRVILRFDNQAGTLIVLRVLPRDRAYRSR